MQNFLLLITGVLIGFSIGVLFSIKIMRKFVKPGAWVVLAYDGPAYPIKLFSSFQELEARQYQGNLGYGEVHFWEYGTEWVKL